MPAAKAVITGPFGAAVRDRLLDEKAAPAGLWLVPSPLAASQVREKLGRKLQAGRSPRVWCWEDFWRAVRDGRDDGPVRLSATAARAALALAIGRARDAAELTATAGVADWPGFRRRVRDRIAGWTRMEVDPGGEPTDAGPTVADEWAIFGHYRAVLGELDAVDSEGFARWASSVLLESPPPELRSPGVVTILDLDEESPPVHRALKFFEAKAKKVRVSLGFDPDPMLAETYSAVAKLRGQLLKRGYVETMHGADGWRPTGLRKADSELFRSDSHTRRAIDDATGVKVLGAPQGEGVGLLVAREVRRLLATDGVASEDVMILVRSWDEHAEALYEVVRSWGLPVSAVGRPRALASEPAVSALRMAFRLPVERWEAASVVSLLRHGRVRPDWEPVRSPYALPRAAAAVRDAGIYRGHHAIRQALDAATADERKTPSRREHLSQARAVIDHLVAAVLPLDNPGTWPEHVDRLRRLADQLGLDVEGDEALERFWNALEDHAAVVGADGRVVTLAAFVDGVESLVGDHCEWRTDIPPGSVVMATVDQAAGARARFVVLANLAEGTFPTRESVEPAEGADEPEQVNRAYSREMMRFLRVFGSADDEVILAYPTRDEKGQEVLASGFLDDLIRRIDPKAPGHWHERHDRFHPALIDHPELAGSPADARARAVALACVNHQPDELARLAAKPTHRRTLEGTAASLLLTSGRLEGRAFNAYDGLLSGPAVARVLATRFGPEDRMSPSQLESYLYCPFQFFLKYVLKARPVDEHGELDEDYARRGSTLHDYLEKYELARKSGLVVSIDDFVIRTEETAELTVESEADPGLHAIERRQIRLAMKRYEVQASEYRNRRKEPSPRPTHFEVAFGGPEKDAAYPSLVIGEGATAVRLQGKIDRVDLIETEQGPAFRVIDYKTGSCPSTKDVKNFLMVQLPLYAMAVERLGLAGEGAALRDVGYWALRDKGFKRIDLDDWPGVRARLEAEVLAAVGRLREGVFVVSPEKPDCSRSCDYATVCRIGQVRDVVKTIGRETR